jgi:hypothetical protein
MFAGCTTFKQAQLDRMNCSSFTMTPGDVLYLPKSVVHFATTDPGVVTSHLTISLTRKGRTWQDVVSGMCKLTGHPLCPYVQQVLDLHVATDQGVPWLELVDSDTPCLELQQRVLEFHPSSLRSALENARATLPSYTSMRDVQQLLARLSKCSSDLGVQDGEALQVQHVLERRDKASCLVHA